MRLSWRRMWPPLHSRRIMRKFQQRLNAPSPDGGLRKRMHWRGHKCWRKPKRRRSPTKSAKKLGGMFLKKLAWIVPNLTKTRAAFARYVTSLSSWHGNPESKCLLFLLQGDSGGPLICNEKLLGLIAFSAENMCNNDEFPHVYMNIPYFVPWIKTVMQTF